MRVVLTFILSLFFLQTYVMAQKADTSDPKNIWIIECGMEKDFTTEGKENNFNQSNYPITESDNYDGEDALFHFFIDQESDVRITINSDCPKATYLFFINQEGDTIDIDFSELFDATRDFIGGVRLYPGEYFFVIDERSSESCGDFTLLLECVPYDPPKVCNYSGNIVSCGKTITDTLTWLERRVIPMGITPNAPIPEAEGEPNFDALVVPGDTCVPKFLNVYQAYFKNPQEIVATLNNKTGNSSVQIMSEDCACIVDAVCLAGECSSNEDESQSILTNAQEGFYYILVTGDSLATYNLNVTTQECDCNYNILTIVPDSTIVENAAGFENNFFNSQNFGLNHYDNCYSGTRSYNGGDVIYEFEVSSTSEVTINLNSFFEAGLFIFDANCKDKCIAHEDTYGINGSATITDFKLYCGVYQIVVDLSRPHPPGIDCPFDLTLSVVAAAEAFDAPPKGPTPFQHSVRLRGGSLVNDRSSITPQMKDNFDFFTFTSDCDLSQSILPIIYSGNHEGDLAGERITDDKSCYYIEELIKLKHLPYDKDNDGREDRYRTSNDLDISYYEIQQQKERYKDANESNIRKMSTLLTQGGPAPTFNTTCLEKDLPANPVAPVELPIFTKEDSDINEKEQWCITIDDEIPSSNPIIINTPFPINGRGTELVRLDVEENATTSTKTINLILKYYDAAKSNTSIRIELSQDGSLVDDCQPDITEPVISNCTNLDTIEINRPIANQNELYDYLLQAIGTTLTYNDLCGAVSVPFILEETFKGNYNLVNGQVDTVSWAVLDNSGNRNHCRIFTKVNIPIPPIPNDPFFTNYPWLKTAPINFDEATCSEGESILIFQWAPGYSYAFFRPAEILYYFQTDGEMAQFYCESSGILDCFESYLSGRTPIATYTCPNTNRVLFPTNKVIQVSKTKSVQVYPNPTNGQLYVDLPPISEKDLVNEIKVYNTFGQEIKNIELSNQNSSSIIPLNLNDLSNGIYYLNVLINNTNQLTKFIISK